MKKPKTEDNSKESTRSTKIIVKLIKEVFGGFFLIAIIAMLRFQDSPSVLQTAAGLALIIYIGAIGGYHYLEIKDGEAVVKRNDRHR